MRTLISMTPVFHTPRTLTHTFSQLPRQVPTPRHSMDPTDEAVLDADIAALGARGVARAKPLLPPPMPQIYEEGYTPPPINVYEVALSS